MKKILTAVAALCVVSASQALEEHSFKAGPSGGYYGNYSQEPYIPNDFKQVVSVTACGAKYLNSVSFKYKDTSNNTYTQNRIGGDGGSCKTLSFDEGQYIASVSGRFGRYIDSITIQKNNGQYITVGGPTGDRAYRYEGDSEMQIAGFFGYYTLLVDSIGVMYYKAP